MLKQNKKNWLQMLTFNKCIPAGKGKKKETSMPTM